VNRRTLARATLVVCPSSVALVAADADPRLTAPAVLLMLSIAPGGAILPRLVRGPRIELGLLLPVSLGAAVLIAQAMLAFGAWDPEAAIYALAAVAVPLAVVELVGRPRPATVVEIADHPLVRPALPPDAQRAWTAEVTWHETDAEARFYVMARSTHGGEAITIARSPALEWPPAGPESVQAVTEAVETLEVSLVAAGWTVLPAGAAWYAKRFAWKPAGDAR
jgi:hypothetical protein